MRIIHTSVLVWIIIVLTTVYIRKLVINTYRFDHNETLVASCLHTVASQDICAVCNVNTIPRLKHKGFSLHSDTPLHLIRYSERDKISC